MAKVMRIGLVPENTTPAGPALIIDFGYVDGLGWSTPDPNWTDSNYWQNKILDTYVDVSEATDIQSIATVSNVGKYDCYIGGVIDEDHKLGFKVAIKRSGNGTGYEGGLLFYNEEISSYFSVTAEYSAGDPVYLVFNTLNPDFDYGTDTISNLANLKSYMTKIVLLAMQGTATRAAGLDDNESAVIIGIHKTADTDYYFTSGTSALDVNFSGGPQVLSKNSSCYVNLTGPFNWFKMLTGSYVYEPPYVETIDNKKIYMSISFDTPINDHLLYGRTGDFTYYDEYGKPLVSAYIQAGTDLTALLKEPGDYIELINGAKIILDYRQVDTNYFYFYKIEYVEGETVYNIMSGINCINDSYNTTTQTNGGIISYTTAPAQFPVINELARRLEGHLDRQGFDNALVGAFLWVKPNLLGILINGNLALKAYVNNHASEAASFWNTFPNTPVTIGYIFHGAMSAQSLDSEGAITNRATRAEAFNLPFAYSVPYPRNNPYTVQTYNIWRNVLVTNIFGWFETSTNYAWNIARTIGGTLGIPETEFVNRIVNVDKGGGEMNIDSAEGAIKLFNLVDKYPDTEPDHGENSEGGGAGDIMDQGEAIGGDGTYDDSSDNMTDPSTIASVESNLLKTWYLGQSGGNDANTRLNALATWLNDTSILASFEDRTQGVITLKEIYSWSAPSVDTATGITIRGNYINVSGQPATTNIQTAYVGAFKLEEYFGSFLDYAPYTSIKIYLPYSGTYDLDPSLLVGSECTVKAKLNLINGDLVYTISVKKGNLDSVIYTFNGNSASELPITSSDYSQKVSSAINTALSATTAVASLATGNVGLGVGAGLNALKEGVTAGLNPGTFKMTGFTGGSVGKFASQYPYLIITRPRKVEADAYGAINGYPSMASRKIGAMKGYIKVYKCNWSIPGATSEEIEEIDQLMKTDGAILDIPE